MKECIKCSLPETYETIEFNSDGVCNMCLSNKFKEEEIDWDKRKKLLDEFILVCKSFCSKKKEIKEKFDKMTPEDAKNNS